MTVIIELTDNKVRSFEGMERSLGIPLIAVLPMFERAGRRRHGAMRLLGRSSSPMSAEIAVPGSPLSPSRFAALDQQPSTFAEGLRSLRTALLLSRSGRPPQVVLITSCLEGEGKTTLALNLAVLLAQSDARVLLVDADLRKPTLCTWFGDVQPPLPGEYPMTGKIPGLGVALASAGEPFVRRPLESMSNFSVLCGDEVPPFPSELLSSTRMASLLENWKSEYDFIVLDSPPVLPVTDAVLLSQMSDATLLVARHGQTTRQALKRSAEALRKQNPGHHALGTVLNGVSSDSGDFYEYFGYQGGLYADAGARAS
jgi:capsular exopolysaccharide synthesis family protein